MRGDGVAGVAAGPQLGGQGASLDEGTVLADGREERGATDFLPEIEAGLIPIPES